MTFPDFVGIFQAFVNTYSGIPGIVFFIIFYKLMTGNARIVFFILLASFSADALNELIFWQLKLHRTYPFLTSFLVSNAWFIVDYFLVSWLFMTLIPNKSKIIKLGLIVYIIGTVISFSFFYTVFESNTFIRTYSSLALTLLSTLSFFEILKEGPTDKLFRYPVFWIITAIFLHGSVTLLSNLFSNYLVFDMEVTWELFSYISLITVTFNIAKNLMFFYAFILIKKGFPDYIYEPKPIKG